MLELARTVRFCLNDTAHEAAMPVRNGFSAWPAMRGLGRYYELHVRCAGEADPVTGYFINIKHIDEAVRRHVVPYLSQRVRQQAGHTAEMPMGSLMREMSRRLMPALRGSIVTLRLQLTPMASLEIRPGGHGEADMNHVTIRQQYEFSASHRLHVPQLSDEQNVATFGKCNNPAGHGHNYRLEVAVRAPIGEDGQALSIDALDAAVDTAVIERLDHRNLNVDVPQFQTLNPSVENIAVVVYDLLKPATAKLGVDLEEVGVWETGKTVCIYRGR